MSHVFLISILFLSVFSAQALQIETVFNTPGFTGQSTLTLENKLIDMIKTSVRGSKIRVALYGVDREPVMKELVYASQRGVDVQVVFDGGNLARATTPGHAVNMLVEGFDGNQGLVCQSEKEDCIKFCNGPLAAPLKLLKLKKNYDLGKGCRGLVNNHNKLFLFSELADGNKNIVAQTSANMGLHQLEMYNDLLIIKNDAIFFDHFMTYWGKLKEDKTILLKKSFPNVSTDEKRLKAYFFPRLVGKDPVLNILRKVNCKLPNSVIRAAQSAFTRGGVAEQMKKLKTEGCKVEVIARIDPRQSSPGTKVREALTDSLIVLPFRGATQEEQSVNSIHTKIVLINASIDNSLEKIPMVLTGSHNLDLFSLRTNDETLIEVRDQQIFDQYNQFLDQILLDARSAGLRLF